MSNLFDSRFWAVLAEGSRNWLITELPGLIIALTLFIFTLKLISFTTRRIKGGLNRISERIEDQDSDETGKRVNTLMDIIQGTFRVILWAIFIMIFMQKFGIDIAPLLAGAGILGLAIGFGAQELVRDFISGFFIILENQIRTGDVAVINGTSGLVEKIGLRTVTLRDFSGIMHIFQNGKINTLSNMTMEWSAMTFDISVAYKENVDQVVQIMTDVGNNLIEHPLYKDQIIEPIEVLGLDKFADNALVIKARIKTKPNQQWAIGREYRKQLKAAFDEKNIEIPFPQAALSWNIGSQPVRVHLKEEKKTEIQTAG